VNYTQIPSIRQEDEPINSAGTEPTIMIDLRFSEQQDEKAYRYACAWYTTPLCLYQHLKTVDK
jgi:hypothetical protein